MTELQKRIKSQVIKTLSPNNTVLEAAQLMAHKRIGSVIITEQNQIVGIFTERDLLNKVVAIGLDPKTTLLEKVLTPNVCTVKPSTSIEECYELMKKVGCRHLPIVNQNGVIAVVSIRHVLNWCLEEVEHERDHLRDYIHQ